MRSGIGRAVLAAGLLVGAACGSDARPVVSLPLAAMQAQHRSQDVASPVALGERDPLPMSERIVSTTRASRNRTGGGAARGTSRTGAPAGDVWAALARCESGMRNLRNHPYSGFFQFTLPTWRSLGYSGEAADHDYGTQLAGAQRLLARSGRGQWPVCGPKVGL